jgi:hypothetical protein
MLTSLLLGLEGAGFVLPGQGQEFNCPFPLSRLRQELDHLYADIQGNRR